MAVTAQQTLSQAGRESAAHVASARLSCRISAEHIRDSKELIDRSLRLLRRGDGEAADPSART